MIFRLNTWIKRRLIILMIIEIIEMFLRIIEYKITFCKTLLYNFKQTNNGNQFVSFTYSNKK